MSKLPDSVHSKATQYKNKTINRQGKSTTPFNTKQDGRKREKKNACQCKDQNFFKPRCPAEGSDKSQDKIK